MLSYGNAISAGVFLAAGLCHLLPHAVEGFAEMSEDAAHGHGHEEEHASGGHSHPFPAAYLLALLGMLVTMAIDKWASEQPGSSHSGHSHSHSHDPHAYEELTLLTGSANNNNSNNNSNNMDNHKHDLLDMLEANRAMGGSSGAASMHHNHNSSNILGGASSLHGSSSPSMSASALPSSNPTSSTTILTSSSSSSSTLSSSSSSPSSSLASSSVFPVVVAILLSFHALVEGAALGVGGSSDDARTVLIAIAAHKFFAAFALGVNLGQAAGLTARARTRALVLFSLASPAGIVLGMVMTSFAERSARSTVAHAMEAVAAGTFIYVGLVEVLLPEFSRPGERLVKAVLVALGVASMSMVSLLF